jgi:phosphoribosylcarboxyaminoimidazole (NCAIR) mutase
MLALSDESLSDKLVEMKKTMADGVHKKDEDIQRKAAEL